MGAFHEKASIVLHRILGYFSSSAFADDRLYRFSQSDIDMIFHRDSAPLELAMLSPHEMQTTEGEWINFVAAGIGAVIGGAYSIGHQIASRSWSWSTFGGHVAAGASAGFRVTNPIGALTAIRYVPVAPGAMLTGAIESRYFGTSMFMNRGGRRW